AGPGDRHRRHDSGDPIVKRTPAIRIFIADDHPIVRQGLRRMVEADPGLAISGEAGDAAALLGALETTATDLVLLDVSMPGGPFLDTLHALRERHPSIRVLVLSVHPEDQGAARDLGQDGEHLPYAHRREDGGREQRRSGPLCREVWPDRLTGHADWSSSLTAARRDGRSPTYPSPCTLPPNHPNVTPPPAP